jgi:hypothetical protein
VPPSSTIEIAAERPSLAQALRERCKAFADFGARAAPATHGLHL